MIKLMQALATEFKTITSNSHHAINQSATVTYPYLTYVIDGQSLGRNEDGINIDVDLFDRNSSYLNLFNLEESIRDHFRDLRIMTNDLYVQFNFTRSQTIETGDDGLIRRNLQIYAKTDWRKK